jgi:hypothetical protein
MRNALFAAVISIALFGAQIVSAQEKPQAEAPAPVTTPSPPPHLAYLDKSKIIYVSDFDAAAGPQVARMMSDALVHDLKKAGYKAKLLGASEARPEDGMLVTGVFAQAGKEGRLRRASLGAVEKTSDVLVYATTANLYHVAKPMYAVAADDSITLNPEVAVLKFDLGKDLSYTAIKKTADQVVAELERISLQAEAEGLGGSGDPLNKFSKP